MYAHAWEVRRLRAAVLMGIAAMLLSACATPYNVACRNIATSSENQYQYTDAEAAVACFASQRYATPDIFEEGDDGTFTLNRRGLKAEEAAKAFGAQAHDLDYFLSYENKSRARTVDWYRGLREGLEHKETVTHAILDRFALVNVFNEFVRQVGPLPQPVAAESEDLSYYFPEDNQKAYSLRLLYSPQGAQLSEVPFVAKYIRTAKREGVLQRVEQFDYSYSRQFAEKVQNLHESNAFRWESRSRSWRIEGYKIVPKEDEPEDATIQYIEIYRLDPETGDPESEPAIRGFLPRGGSTVKVFLIDNDREGDTGYGVPDSIKKISADLKTVRHFFKLSGILDSLLEAAYEGGGAIDRDRPARQEPPEMPIYTAIAHMGDVSIEVWEQGEWEVPFAYQEGLRTENALVFAELSPNDPQHSREEHRQIDAFVRKYNRGADTVVLAYWEPKDAFNDRDIVEASARSNAIEMLRKGSIERRGEIEYFASHVRQIDYRFGGKWLRIVDEDGDGVFEKRREISKPELVDSTTSATRASNESVRARARRNRSQ